MRDDRPHLDAQSAGPLDRWLWQAGVLLLFVSTAIVVLVRLIVPWLVAGPASSLTERAAASIGVFEIGVAQAVAAVFSELIWGHIRPLAVGGFVVGLVLAIVVAVRAKRGESDESAAIRDHEAWAEPLVEPADDANGGWARRAAAIGAAVVVIAALGWLAMRVLTGGGLESGLGGLLSGGDGPVAPAATEVVLSEMVASNASTAFDEDGEASDWIELHNPTDQPVSLAGHFLSDDDSAPDRWQLPDVEIEPGGYLLVWASGKDRDDPAAGLHTDFSIAADGEPVLFVAPDGTTVIDRFEPVVLPRDVAWGRDSTDPDRQCFFAVATPAAGNAAECFDDLGLGAPELSVSSGFQPQPFGVEISVEDPSATILYTLDGSYPDLELNPDRTLIYDGPLRIVDRSDLPARLALIDPTLPMEDQNFFAPGPDPIQQATVLRARTAYSAETVATYFVGADQVREGLPVVSLVFDEEFFFDHEQGIYVAGQVFDDYRDSAEFDEELPPANMPANFNQRGRDWERPPLEQLRRAVVMEYCAPGGACEYQRNVGVRVHGGATRLFQQKSLRLYARNDYGNRVFDYPFFGTTAPSDQRRLILRNSGNDQGRTMIMDAYLQGLMATFAADTQAYQPVVVYLNGEYWGIHNIRERYDPHYLELYYQADPDTVVAFEGGLAFDEEGRELLEALADTDPTSDDTMAWIEQRVDLDSWIDFLIAHLHAGNPDWPGRNERLWRQPDGPHTVGEGVLDGRWRWQIVDLDQMGGRLALYDADYDAFTERLPATDDVTLYGGAPFMFNHLMQHPDFVHRFATRYLDHLNTSFHPDRTSAFLDETVGGIADEVDWHMNRYSEFTTEFFLDQVELLRGFMQQRPDAARSLMVELFDLGSPVTLQLETDSSQGTVRVNTVLIDPTTPGVVDPAQWEGVYVAGMPISLEAVPWSGHRFVGWQGLPADVDATQPQVTFVPDDDASVTAVFATD